MQPDRAALSALFVLSFLLSGAPLGAIAASSGLAWDSVTKIAVNADPASLQPGSFDGDFSAAAAVQQPEQGGGGIFKQIHQAMSEGQSMRQMMQTGMAEHHYAAGSKDRTDHLFFQTATIVDCSARTITTLDLRRKTYKVVSMDQPSSPDSGGTSSSSQGRSPDNDTRVAIAVTNTALGARNVGGQPTDGYSSQMTITETSSAGQSQTQNGNLRAWYSSFANPAPTCSGGSAVTGGRAAAGMAGYMSAMRALASAGGDPRFSVSQSGPRLPLGRLPMYDAMTLGMQGQGATFVTERGNVRSIDAKDPIFSVPEGFTQQQ
ncbi:MAG: hypothetical protein WAK19_01825 [Candidatus Cybelea sp.]